MTGYLQRGGYYSESCPESTALGDDVVRTHPPALEVKRIRDWGQKGAQKFPREDLELLVRLFRVHGLGSRSYPLAVHLLSRTGGLGSLLSLSKERLRQFGMLKSEIDALSFIGSTINTILRRRAQDSPLINDVGKAIDFLMAKIGHLNHEEMVILHLNSRNHLILDDTISRGTINRAIVYPREILIRCLEVGSTGIILAHNHPSGNTEPSKDDIVITRMILRALTTVEIKLYDHIVIGRGNYTSMFWAGYLE